MRFITRRESPTEPPNYLLRDLPNREAREVREVPNREAREARDSANRVTAVAQFPDPQPSLRGITKQLVTYQRADGVPLSFTLYLPAHYKQGTRLPTVVWAYPREFDDADTAAQITGSPYRFTTIDGLSHLFFLTQGYAVLDNAAMPIIGSPRTVNDTYIEQLVANAQAAIDKAVEMGVTDRDADKLFAPASTTKLYSVASALDHLGADFRFQTPVVRRGETNGDGALTGDLILIASGDLTMGGRTLADATIAFKNNDRTYANGSAAGELTEPDPLAGLDELARQVAANGIRRVKGEVSIDDRLFDKEQSSGSGPAQLTPILINDNLIDAMTTPAKKPGEPASIVWRPQPSTMTLEAKVDTVEAGKPTSVSVSISGAALIVRGTIAVDHKPLLRVAEVPDAASFARTLFVDALRRAGVEVEASAAAPSRASALPVLRIRRTRDDCAKLPQVARLESPPFSENAKLILKVSHNLHASTLPLLVAAKNGKRSLADGLRLQGEFLKKLGVDADAISFGGGAGGARSDYVSPQVTVQLLRANYSS